MATATKKAEPAAKAEGSSNNDAVMQKARSTAMSQLRANHTDEFNQLVKEAAAKLGVEWNPRPSKKDRAKKKMAELLAEYPELADEINDDES
jgi:hypothetical protein